MNRLVKPGTSAMNSGVNAGKRSFFEGLRPERLARGNGKSGEVNVAGIHVVPQCPRLVLGQIIGNERRLAGSRRPGNPNQGMVTMVFSE